MEKEFAPYELAVKLKELGFDEPCFAYYNGYEELDHLMPERVIVGRNYNGDTITSAPLYQQAFRWFREKHNLFGCIDLHVSNPKHWYIRIDDIIKNDYVYHSEDTLQEFYTYEEAELACLTKLIELLKEYEDTV